jgi:hypothetical protein
MNLLLSTHRDGHTLLRRFALRLVVLSLPYVGRELGCGLPLICSTERISGCMREGTDVHSSRGCRDLQTQPVSHLQQWGNKSSPRTSDRAQTFRREDRTPLFLSRLLTRVPSRTFVWEVGSGALGSSRNFEVSPFPEHCGNGVERPHNQSPPTAGVNPLGGLGG